MFINRDSAGNIVGRFAVRQYEGQEVIADDDPELLVPLEMLKAEKLGDVNNEFQRAASVLTAGYPDDEKYSWPNQTQEAMAWYADNATPTPYLDALAGYRGLDPFDYRQRTVNKVLQYKAASAILIGARQKYADQIDAAVDADDLDAIEPDFTIPS